MNELFGKESAQAIGKVADTAAKGIDAGREFGGFFSRHFGGTVEQWTGLWEDKLKYRRWENQVALMLKAETKIKELGLEGKLRPLEMKIGVPLLEAASLEEDDYLLDLWASLLVNAANQDIGQSVKRSFIATLQIMSHLDALIFNYLYEQRENDRQQRFESIIDDMTAIQTPLDHTAEVEVTVDGQKQVKRKYKALNFVPYVKYIPKKKVVKHTMLQGFEESEIELSLWTLHQLGCLEIYDDRGHMSLFKTPELYFTPLGIALYKACTLKEVNHAPH